MTNLDCNSTWPFYCYFDNLVLVKENKTWEEALEHCRAMDLVDPQRNDLISISGPLDHHTVWFRINKATTNEVVQLYIYMMKCRQCCLFLDINCRISKQPYFSVIMLVKNDQD